MVKDVKYKFPEICCSVSLPGPVSSTPTPPLSLSVCVVCISYAEMLFAVYKKIVLTFCCCVHLSPLYIYIRIYLYMCIYKFFKYMPFMEAVNYTSQPNLVTEKTFSKVFHQLPIRIEIRFSSYSK